jgi:hypothetical protein
MCPHQDLEDFGICRILFAVFSIVNLFHTKEDWKMVKILFLFLNPVHPLILVRPVSSCCIF